MGHTSQDRLVVLKQRVARLERRMAHLNERSNSYKMLQLLIFVAGIIVSIPALAAARWLGGLVIIAGIVSIVLLGSTTSKIALSFLKYKSWLQLINAQIARIQLDWDNMPPLPLIEVAPDHPFNNDLDISGGRSLHQLINTAVSFEGTQLLLDWLLNRVPDLDAIRNRQALVQELVPLTRFRDRLLINSLFATRFSSEALDGERLVAWLEDEEQTVPTLSLTTISVTIGLWVLALVLFALYMFLALPPVFCILAWFLYIGWFMMKRKEFEHIGQDAGFVNLVFDQLSTIFTYLEKYPYKKHSQLRMLCEPFFLHGDRRPSILLPKLRQITKRASLAGNINGWLAMNALVPLGFYTAWQLKRDKALVTEYLPTWLDVWYELEALCSLANFAYLNPEYVVPDIVTGKAQDTSATFRARGLGHPLIAKEHKVVNDFHLNEPGELIMITGSNMAGKSTFLRSIGVNLCLAFAGSVVNATSLQTSLYELYACIKVTDSLADGYSYFYAEVRRLKGLLTEVEQGTQFPLFFLIDEIFKGTNNYERLIGSEAYIRALLGQKCVGAISTHDLELVKLADLFPAIKNYHFREDIVNGQMVFDYILRSGPSPTRNALRIMQMEGLPVTWDATSQVATSS